MLLSTVDLQSQDPKKAGIKKDEKIDGFPASLQPWRDPNRRNVIVLDEDYNSFFLRTDRSGDERKESQTLITGGQEFWLTMTIKKTIT